MVSRFLPCALLAALLHADLAAQSVVLTPSTVTGVAAYVAPAADYFERADDVLGATRSAPLNAWLPYGVALTNRTAQNLIAVAVRWTADVAAGQPATFVLKSHMFDQSRQQWAPGKSVIAIPVALLGLSRLPPELQLTPMGGALSPSPVLREFQRARRVEATLDGIVLASGQFIGQNTANEYEEFVAEATAPARVASAILAMRTSGEKVATVVAWLQSTAHPPADPRSTDRNAQVAARTAKLLLRQYRRGGEALLYEVAHGYAQGPAIHLYR